MSFNCLVLPCAVLHVFFFAQIFVFFLYFLCPETLTFICRIEYRMHSACAVHRSQWIQHVQVRHTRLIVLFDTLNQVINVFIKKVVKKTPTERKLTVFCVLFISHVLVINYLLIKKSRKKSIQIVKQ